MPKSSVLHYENWPAWRLPSKGSCPNYTISLASFEDPKSLFVARFLCISIAIAMARVGIVGDKKKRSVEFRKKIIWPYSERSNRIPYAFFLRWWWDGLRSLHLSSQCVPQCSHFLAISSQLSHLLLLDLPRISPPFSLLSPVIDETSARHRFNKEKKKVTVILPKVCPGRWDKPKPKSSS